MYILGISCFYHDSAACLIRDGEIVAAANEERFTRKKHDSSFPKLAIKYCLEHAGITPSSLDYVGFYDKPILKFDRILSTYIATWPKSYLAFLKFIPAWFKEKLWTQNIIRENLCYRGPIYFVEHHMSHAASAFLVSPFTEAAILTVDGVGEWATASFGIGRKSKVELLKEIHFPDSLGLLYSAFTYYLGFKVNSAEYKVMGAAPYGRPVYYDKIMSLIDLKDDGSFLLNKKYFSWHYGLKMINKRFEQFFGHPTRKSEDKIEQWHWDLAASLQKVTEEIVLRMANYVQSETGMDSLCMAGGVALNCVANSRVLRETRFKNIFFQPAAGDDGGALGVAFYIWNSILGNPRRFTFKHAYWGPEYTNDQIRIYLRSMNVAFKELSEVEIVEMTARLIADQKVIGWFQGRMEWGPRALGNRSILADARNKDNWQRVNLKIKFRESFRPFAPSVLEEEAKDYFDLDCQSPYMLLVAQVKKDTVPAITHVDGSARIQTVSKEQNPLYHSLLSAFKRLTNCPLLINTSFNVRGEPIVCSPEDAFWCFMHTDMDYLVLGNFILDKRELSNQGFNIDKNAWLKKFALD